MFLESNIFFNVQVSSGTIFLENYKKWKNPNFVNILFL